LPDTFLPSGVDQLLDNALSSIVVSDLLFGGRPCGLLVVPLGGAILILIVKITLSASKALYVFAALF